MATYSTDLTTLNTTDSTGTYTEFASPYNGGGTPGHSGEQYIQGVDCVAQNTGKANGLEISCVYDHGSGYSFGTDEVIFMWMFYFAGTNLESYANSGWRLAIGSSTSAWDWFRVGGSDYGAHKYGGWFNFAVDPTVTETGQIGGGNGGTYRYFGNVPYTLNEVTKGDPVAIDAIRAGRGEISVTGSGGSFSELAEYNDYNAGGTPPGTSSTSVDSGRHVLGLFQAAGGSYLWKGLMSLGLTGTSVTLSDSNETIVIDDCPHTYAAFNKVEINNSGSSVTLNNITFISTATTANGVGHFEVVDNATVLLQGCSFNDMGTFVFNHSAAGNSNTINNCTFNNCGQIDQGTAIFDGCSFNNSTSPFLTDEIANIGSNSACTFVGDGTTTPGHALDGGTIPGSAGTITLPWYNVLDNGANQSTWEGSTQTPTAGPSGSANDAVVVNVGSGTTLKISVQAGATIPKVQNLGTGNVEITANEVTLTITVRDISDNTVIQDAMVYCTNAAETATYINKIETNASGQVSFTGSLGSAQVLAGNVRAATPASKAYTKYYKAAPIVGTFSNTQNTDITVSLIPDE